jgi:hypothetical protein
VPLPLAVTVQTSQTVTASGSGAAVDLLDPAFAPDGLPRAVVTLLLDVTAASGTSPSLTVTVETSPSGSSWEPVLAFAAQLGTGYQRLRFGPLERYVRVRWVVAGTLPSITFSITGTAEVVYADHDDFYALGLPHAAIGTTDPPDLLTSCLLAASSQVTSRVPPRYKFPLRAPYPESLKQAVCAIAALKFLQQRGFDPDDPADKEVEDAHDEALAWLEGIATDETIPDWIDATPSVDDVAPDVFTNDMRGW